ncbi:MAG: methionine adenosyltransferase [Candidatus Eisenbacteria bacterium]|nr:methionine adenosyltransferase [Candidatus Eisenbacteria bacterium]
MRKRRPSAYPASAEPRNDGTRRARILEDLRMAYVFTSESITEGHPDKVCDLISDSILDAYLEQDRQSRVACETMAKGNAVVLGGEITSRGKIDLDRVVRDAIRSVGYVCPDEPFCADSVEIHRFLSKQSPEISRKVDQESGEQGAGDQGLMFGFAARETETLMPLPIHLAHRLSEGLAEDRKSGRAPFLRPDGKTQVSVLYDGNTPMRLSTVVVSTQHEAAATPAKIEEYVMDGLLPRVLGDWHRDDMTVHVNPGGSFVEGGPSADCGLTGRKIIADTYGGMGRHGGGAFSGKDPSKVDRSAAYFCRYVARRVVEEGLADRAEIQVAYAIGGNRPVSVKVDTFGTGDEKRAEDFVCGFDFSPRAIVDQLGLLQPIFKSTVNYGHFGRPGFTWEGAPVPSSAGAEKR